MGQQMEAVAKALSRVDRFGNFLATQKYFIDEDEEMRNDHQRSDGGSRYKHRYRHASSKSNTDHCRREIICSVEGASVSDEESQSSYIGCIQPQQYNSVVIEEEQQQQQQQQRSGVATTPKTCVVSPKKNDALAARRNLRFKRFVKAKHNQRAKTLNTQEGDKVDHITHCQDEEELTTLAEDEITTLVEVRAHLMRVQQHLKEYDVSSSPASADQHTGTRKVEAVVQFDSDSDAVTASPPRINRSTHAIVQQYNNSEDSPTSVGQLPSFVEQSADNVKKKLFVGNSDTTDVKGRIIQPQLSQQQQPPKCNVEHSSERQEQQQQKKKNLTWYDDHQNKHKPFNLKTDESLDWLDDTSAWSNVDNNNNVFQKCNAVPKNVQDFISKRVKWIDEDENSPYESPSMVLFKPSTAATSGEESYDEDNSSLCDGVVDNATRRAEIIGNLIDYYRRKLEDSFSHVVDATKELELELNIEESFTLHALDDAIDSIDKAIMPNNDGDDGMASLFKMDLFDTSSSFLQGEDNDDDTVATVTTPHNISCFDNAHACNTSCFEYFECTHGCK